MVKEKIYKFLFGILAFSSLLFLVGITVILFTEGLPIFHETGIGAFIFGKAWYPTYDPPEFGIFPLLVASFWVTLGALLVGVPLGVGSALFINELAGPKIKAILKPLIEILAAIPSIVFGFFWDGYCRPFFAKTSGHSHRSLCVYRELDFGHHGSSYHLQYC